MKIHGITLTEQQLQHVLSCLGKKKIFQKKFVEEKFLEVGVPEKLHPEDGRKRVHISDRAAERFLQKLKREGVVMYTNNYWFWVGGVE